MGWSVKSFKKKFKKYTGLQFEGAVAGAILGPVGVIIGGKIGPSVSEILSDPLGVKAAAKEQAAALRAAGKIEEAQRLEAKLFRAQIIAETAGVREQGQAELARFQAQRPGETEFYKQALSRGTESIAEQRARFGLTESGGTGRRFEELGSQLLSQEELIRQQGIARAAQLSQTGYGLGLGALGQEGAAAFRLAQTTANIGAARAQAKLANRQFYTGLATQLGGIALGAYAGGGAGAAAGGVGAQQLSSAPQQGGYTLQQGLGYQPYQPIY